MPNAPIPLYYVGTYATQFTRFTNDTTPVLIREVIFNVLGIIITIILHEIK